LCWICYVETKPSAGREFFQDLEPNLNSRPALIKPSNPYKTRSPPDVLPFHN
jgi:hypothetical protein